MSELTEIQIIVLTKLLDAGEKGVTIYDFPESLNLDAGSLDQIILELNGGLDEHVH